MSTPEHTYQKFAAFYDLYVGRFSADVDFYHSYCSSDKSIVEIGCGTGRILKYLLDKGLSVTGIDISDEMLQKAGAKLEPYVSSGHLKLLNHNFAEKPFETKIDVALLTFYTFNYILDKPESFLTNIHRSLNRQANLLIDVFYPMPLKNKAIDNVWNEKYFEIEGQQVLLKDKRTMNGNVEHRCQVFSINGSEGISIDTFRRYFPPKEMVYLLKNADFSDVKLAPGYDFRSLKCELEESELGDNFIVVAKK
ncbi:MAG TPA: class I SAM-dependent methyltransferase [Bacteroidales bacterium]